MPRAEEWDWPPPRRPRAAQIEGRIVQERIVVPTGRAVPKRPNRGLARAADAFGSLIFTLIKIGFAIALSGIVLACLALIGAILKA